MIQSSLLKSLSEGPVPSTFENAEYLRVVLNRNLGLKESTVRVIAVEAGRISDIQFGRGADAGQEPGGLSGLLLSQTRGDRQKEP